MRSRSQRKKCIAGAAAGLGVALLIAHAGAQEGSRTRGEVPTRELRVEQSRIDPAAAAVVRRMADHLASIRSFRVSAESSTELVLSSGEKIQVLATSNVAVQRPNRLRSERRGPLTDITFIYDGDSITLYGRRENVYAQMDAPRTLDAALDFARERLEIEAPGADLLYSNLYEGLMDGVESGRHLGEVEVDGVVCEHVAFRSEDVDWQLWVERGDQPLPRRYVIVTKDQEASPEFIVELRDWDVAPRLAANEFQFTPPNDAIEIEFLAEAPRARARREIERQGTEGAGT